MNTASAATVSRGYGVHMAIGMSIGFLNLGGACYKFNTSNESVAMLLISMWPALPCSPSDNRCHLQVRRFDVTCSKTSWTDSYLPFEAYARLQLYFLHSNSHLIAFKYALLWLCPCVHAFCPDTCTDWNWLIQLGRECQFLKLNAWLALCV